MLDERSARDKTVVLHYNHPDYDDPSEDPPTLWRSWRTRFAEVWPMSTD